VHSELSGQIVATQKEGGVLHFLVGLNATKPDTSNLSTPNYKYASDIAQQPNRLADDRILPPPFPMMPDTESSSSTPRAAARTAKPHVTLLRLGLAPLIVHFRSTTGYIAPTTLESYDHRILGRVRGDTAKVEDVRYVFEIIIMTALSVDTAYKVLVLYGGHTYEGVRS
jgi:hypothetical protein